MPEMTLNLDMLEAVRLVDAEGLSQGEAAEQMGISTPTLCRLLGEARRRIAVALRDGMALYCNGGNVQICPHHEQQHRGGPHGRGPGNGKGPGRGPRAGRMCGREETLREDI